MAPQKAGKMGMQQGIDKAAEISNHEPTVYLHTPIMKDKNL